MDPEGIYSLIIMICCHTTSVNDQYYIFNKVPVGDLSLIKKEGAYVYMDSMNFAKMLDYKILSFGKDGIAYEAFDMPAYPTNKDMSSHFWGMPYY
jgi:hypothetical protein